MSTYAVFGMTISHAKEMARKAVDRRNSGKHVPESKWIEMVAAETEEIMKSTRISVLSNKFDAPFFAKQFKDLVAKNESRDLHIKAWCKSGEQLKSGRDKMHWVSS